MESGIEVVSSDTLAVLNRSDIEQQVSTAHKYPRSIRKFRDEALSMATLTERIAGECMYALPRKENGRTKMIEGPSARMAEIVASAWGNCRAGARIVAEDDKFITAQGVFHDLERNVAITYEVRRRITNKEGRKFSDDMVSTTANAACSIALRNAVFKGIPKAFWADIYDSARQTSMGDAKTLTTRRSEALGYFKKLGVTDDLICSTLGVPSIDDIGMEELAVLKGLATSIKDGEITSEQAFNSKDSSQEVKAKEVVERFATDKNHSDEPKKPKDTCPDCNFKNGRHAPTCPTQSKPADDLCPHCSEPRVGGVCRNIKCEMGEPG